MNQKPQFLTYIATRKFIPAIMLPLLFISGPEPLSAAQNSTSHSPPPSFYPNYPYASLNLSMSIVIVMLFFAFFFMAFLSIYIRQCHEDSEHRSNPHPTTASFRRPKHGLEPNVVRSFPIFCYREIKGLRIGRDVWECAVCLSEFENDDAIKLMPKCCHVFHRECIDSWLACQSTCPVCRANLVPRPGEASAEGADPTNLSGQGPYFRTESMLEPVRNQLDQC